MAAACLQLVLAVNERNSYGCSCQIRGLLAFVAALRRGNSYSNGRIQSSSRCLLACSARLLALRVVSRLCALSCGGDFFYRATLCVSAVFAVALCPYVRRVGGWIVSRRLNISSTFFLDAVAPSF